jgi:hypothetical protein
MYLWYQVHNQADEHRYHDEKLLHIAKLVSEVFIGSDGGRLKHVPAPPGAVHVEP